MSKREEWVDILKGFAIICVVLGHVIERTIVGLNLQSSLLTSLNYFIYSFHMPLFFLCSGYVYAITTRIREERGYFVRKKAVDLLIPYTFFAIVVWLGKYIFANYVTYAVTFKDLMYMYVNPIAFLWYIYILFFVSCMVYILDIEFKQNTKILLFITLAMCLSRCFITTSVKIVDRVLFYPIFYVLGILVHEKKNRINMCAVGVLCIGFVIAFIFHYRYQESMILTIASNIIGSLFFTTLFYLLFSKNESQSIVGYLGKRTIYLYILHPIVINAVRAAILLIGFKNAIGWFALLTILGITLPIVFELMFHKLVVFDFLFRPSYWIREMKRKSISNNL